MDNHKLTEWLHIGVKIERGKPDHVYINGKRVAPRFQRRRRKLQRGWRGHLLATAVSSLTQEEAVALWKD